MRWGVWAYGVALLLLMSDLRNGFEMTCGAEVLAALYMALPAWFLGRRVGFCRGAGKVVRLGPQRAHPDAFLINQDTLDKKGGSVATVWATAIVWTLFAPFLLGGVTLFLLAVALPAILWAASVHAWTGTTLCLLLWPAMLWLGATRIRERQWWQVDPTTSTLSEHCVVADLQMSEVLGGPVVAVGAAVFPSATLDPLWRVRVYLADGSVRPVGPLGQPNPVQELAERMSRALLLPHLQGTPEDVCKWIRDGQLEKHCGSEWPVLTAPAEEEPTLSVA